MTLVVLIISAILLAYGWASGNELSALAGSIIFISFSSLSLIYTYHASKLYRDGVFETGGEEKKKSFVDTLAAWLSGIIVFAGLIAMIIGDTDRYKVSLSGGIIWIGSILIWFVSGIVVREVTGIPLKMGYGGWFVSRPHRRSNRRRSHGRK